MSDKDLLAYIVQLEKLLEEREQKIRELREELAVTDKLLNDRSEIIKLIPPCPQHGDDCLPNAREWIEMNKRARMFADGIQLAPLWRTHK